MEKDNRWLPPQPKLPRACQAEHKTLLDRIVWRHDVAHEIGHAGRCLINASELSIVGPSATHFSTGRYLSLLAAWRATPGRCLLDSSHLSTTEQNASHPVNLADLIGELQQVEWAAKSNLAIETGNTPLNASQLSTAWPSANHFSTGRSLSSRVS